MDSLIKHHLFMIDGLSYFLIGGLIVGGHIVLFPPTFLFIVTVTSLMIAFHYYLDKNKSNQFLISLPISFKAIIHSKYIFIFIMVAFIILLQGITMLIINVFVGTSQYTYDWRDIIVLLCTATIILSIIIPIYHFFKSMILSTTIVAMIFLIGFFTVMNRIIDVMVQGETIIFNNLDPGLVLITEKYIPYEPYTILISATLLLLFISMKVSVYLFKVRDES